MSHQSHLMAAHFRSAGWLPVSNEAFEDWLRVMVLKVRQPSMLSSKGSPATLAEIAELQRFIESNSDMYMGFHRMFNNEASPFFKHIKHYKEMLAVMRVIVTEAPDFGDVGPPMFMILASAMDAQGGFTTFLNKELNHHFKRIFDKWAIFLSSPASCHTLHAGKRGWFSPEALCKLTALFGGLPFEDIFECDPASKFWGFTSYDDFFNRRFRPGVRSLECPDNENIINGACESQFYNIRTDVKKRDEFWIKGEPYSLADMLNRDESTAQFVGGTVFQGFLQVTGYHRWHAPAAGTVKKIVTVPGTYFVQSPANLNQLDPINDPGYLRSLGFISSLATRQLFFIEADNPRIGLFVFIAIGMTEISGTEATVKEGQKISKGEEIGMFHFGGSSHVLVFRPEAKVHFFPRPVPGAGSDDMAVKVCGNWQGHG
ncbi:phosphatidylserine decarboxylase [Mycena crocata]|nr:phosphatidylserine decarboxylase [Mycena crocata]